MARWVLTVFFPTTLTDSLGTELGRPQIHGYPVASVTFTDRLQFISGADEKIVRVFDAPRIFLSGLGKLSGVTDIGDEVGDLTTAGET